MVAKYFDRVKETSTTTGPGDIALAGAVQQHVSFSSVFAIGDTFYYTALDQRGADWEVGIGMLSAPTVMDRVQVLASSNNGNLVNFSTGALFVYNTFPAIACALGEIKNATVLSPVMVSDLVPVIRAGVIYLATVQDILAAAQPNNEYGNAAGDNYVNQAGDNYGPT